MNKPDKERLRHVIRKMRKQSDYEKFEELTAVCPHVPLKVSFNTVEFPPDDFYHTFPLPMKNIHCVAREEDYLYILCENNSLHVLGLKERGHFLIPLEGRPSLWEMFCWTCRSCYDRLRLRIAKEK